MTFGRFPLSVSLVFLILLGAVSMAGAQEKLFQLALVTPIQIHPASAAVSGLRINLLYGRNTYVTGLDVGLVNHTTLGESNGLQSGLVSLADNDFSGGQEGLVTVVKGNLEGAQWGFVNYANDVRGFQFGVVNYARTMKGLQIGLVNIIKQGGQFPVFPIINWSF